MSECLKVEKLFSRFSAIFNDGKILVPQARNENDSVTTQERGNLSIGEGSVNELKKGLRAAV
jgi:hypothetical protein